MQIFMCVSGIVKSKIPNYLFRRSWILHAALLGPTILITRHCYCGNRYKLGRTMPNHHSHFQYIFSYDITNWMDRMILK